VFLRHFFQVIFSNGLPFLLVCAAGIAQGIVFFWVLAPRLLPTYWAERALVEFGVSIGATSTGLLLLRMADPDGKTPVLRDFTFKQIFHVLITGGGFFDVLVPIPLTSVTRSAWPLFVVVTTVIAMLLLAHPAVGRRCARLCRCRTQAPSSMPPPSSPRRPPEPPPTGARRGSRIVPAGVADDDDGGAAPAEPLPSLDSDYTLDESRSQAQFL